MLDEIEFTNFNEIKEEQLYNDSIANPFILKLDKSKKTKELQLYRKDFQLIT